MTCCLCREDRKLVEAHIIPRSFYRIDPADRLPSRLLTNVEGRYPQKVPIGVYDNSILCEGCERRFSPWDDYANKLFVKSWDKFEAVSANGKGILYRLPTFDYKLLKLFFLSVLWRASVSGQSMFSKIDLGLREPIVREAILKSDPGSPDFFGVVLQAFDSTAVGMLDPHPERFDNIRFVRFYLSHVIAFIKVDSRPLTEPFGSAALKPDHPLLLIQKSFMTSPERRIMREMVLDDQKQRLIKSQN